MNLKKKILNLSLATVLAISPVAIMSVPNAHFVTAARITQSKRLKLIHNAYVYNRRGKRTRYNGHYKLYPNQSVRFLKKIKPVNGSKRYYFKDNQGNNFYLPYTKIRGSYYYQIGKNAYLNCVNVSTIAGRDLYTSQAKVTLRTGDEGVGYKRSQPYLINVPNPTNHVSLYGTSAKPLKVGQKVTIDGIYYNQDMSNQDFTFYRIKGTSGRKTQVIPADYINNKPRQELETVRASCGLYTRTQTPVYNAAGQVISQKGLHKNYGIASFEKVWLWVPSAQKAELFYQMSDKLWSTEYDDTNADYQSGGIVPYLPVDDVNYQSGPTLKPVNTAAQAEADARIATNSEKQELQNLINEQSTIINSTAFRLDPSSNYDGALLLDKRLLKDQTATVNQVKEAVRYTQRIKNSFQGVKIPVKDIKHLTRKEADAVREAVQQYYYVLNYYNQHSNNDYQAQFNNDRSQLTLITRQYQDRKNQEPQYLIKTTRQELKISDYAEQK